MTANLRISQDETAGGDPSAEQICFQLTSSEDSLLPGDVDSPSGPPPAQDEFYIGSVDDVDNSHLSLYSFQVTTWNPPVASITGSPNTQLVTVASYSGSCHGSFGGTAFRSWAPPPNWSPWVIA